MVENGFMKGVLKDTAGKDDARADGALAGPQEDLIVKNERATVGLF